MTTTDDILKRLGIEPISCSEANTYRPHYTHSDLECIVAEMLADASALNEAAKAYAELGWEAQIQKLEDTLKELVDLKALKSSADFFKDEVKRRYESRKIKAWHNAREVLSTTSPKSALDAAIRQAKIEALEDLARGYQIRTGVKPVMALAALALPHDDTALKEYVQEKCVKGLNYMADKWLGSPTKETYEDALNEALKEE